MLTFKDTKMTLLTESNALKSQFYIPKYISNQ